MRDEAAQSFNNRATRVPFNAVYIQARRPRAFRRAYDTRVKKGNKEKKKKEEKREKGEGGEKRARTFATVRIFVRVCALRILTLCAPIYDATYKARKGEPLVRLRMKLYGQFTSQRRA